MLPSLLSSLLFLLQHSPIPIRILAAIPSYSNIVLLLLLQYCTRCYSYYNTRLFLLQYSLLFLFQYCLAIPITTLAAILLQYCLAIPITILGAIPITILTAIPIAILTAISITILAAIPSYSNIVLLLLSPPHGRNGACCGPSATV